MRCAVVSDIHANFHALEAVLADAGDVDQVWCLGDIVDGGPQPNECVDALRKCNAVCIFGNHEEWLLQDSGPIKEWTHWTYAQLSPLNLDFLRALRGQVTIGEFTLLHAPLAGLAPPVLGDLARFASRFCLNGHTHLPLVCRAAMPALGETSLQIRRSFPGERIVLDAERAIVNVGSVGTSFVDPRRADYVLVEEPGEAGTVTLSFRSVPYPVESFIAKLHECGLPPPLALRREQGFSELSPVARRTLAAHQELYADLAPHGGDRDAHPI